MTAHKTQLQSTKIQNKTKVQKVNKKLSVITM